MSKKASDYVAVIEEKGAEIPFETVVVSHPKGSLGWLSSQTIKLVLANSSQSQAYGAILKIFSPNAKPEDKPILSFWLEFRNYCPFGDETRRGTYYVQNGRPEEFEDCDEEKIFAGMWFTHDAWLAIKKISLRATELLDDWENSAKERKEFSVI